MARTGGLPRARTTRLTRTRRLAPDRRRLPAGLYEPGLVGEYDCLSAVAKIELGEDVLDVGLDRLLSQEQPPAISVLDRPAAISINTSRSRSVSCDSWAVVAVAILGRWAKWAMSLQAERGLSSGSRMLVAIAAHLVQQAEQAIQFAECGPAGLLDRLDHIRGRAVRRHRHPGGAGLEHHHAQAFSSQPAQDKESPPMSNADEHAPAAANGGEQPPKPVKSHSCLNMLYLKVVPITVPAVEKHHCASRAVGSSQRRGSSEPGMAFFILADADALTPVVNDQCANGGQGGAGHPVVVAAQQESNRMRASIAGRNEDPHHRSGGAAARTNTQSARPGPVSPVVGGRSGSLVVGGRSGSLVVGGPRCVLGPPTRKPDPHLASIGSPRAVSVGT